MKGSALHKEGKGMQPKFLLVFAGALYGVLLLAALLLQSGRAVPADAGAINTANQLITAGNYAEATRIYEQLLDQGVNDSVVFYNLGNAYYQQGDVGRAILNYERALQLAPRDRDIQANLTLARQQVQGSLTETAPGPLALLASATGRWLTLDETAFLLLGLWFVAGLLFLAWQQFPPGTQRRRVRRLALVAAMLIVLGGGSLASRLYTARTYPEGVIVAQSIGVSSEPGAPATTGLALPGGSTVHLTEIRGQWAHLSAPGGAQKGWVPLGAVEAVAKWEGAPRSFF